MPTVGICGCEWVRGGIILGWGTGRRQSEPRVAVDSRSCTPAHPRDNKKSSFVEEGQGRLLESRLATRVHVKRANYPTKTDNKMHKKKRKQNGKERTDINHRHIRKNATTQHVIQPPRTAKTNKNNEDKTHNTVSTLSAAPHTRKLAKTSLKTRKNNKRRHPKPKQETKQRNQQHYFR